MYPGDDFFSSLAKMIGEQFQIQIVQLWAARADNRGQTAAELQGMFCQDKTFPQNFLTNPQIAAVAERAAQEQASPSIHMVGTIFPQPVAIFLKRHSMNYCVYFSLGNAVLSSVKMHVSTKEFPVPAAIVILLFLEQWPARDFVSGIRSTLQNSFTNAARRGLLQLVPADMSAQSADGYAPPALSSLIPQRIEDMTSSPLAFSGAGLDASVRHFYAPINNRRDVGELSRLAHCSMEQAYTALQTLLTQRRIKLYEPGGKEVEKLPPFYKQ
jgi:hypothetical protein